jgi:Na+/phosphate symporter
MGIYLYYHVIFHNTSIIIVYYNVKSDIKIGGGKTIMVSEIIKIIRGSSLIQKALREFVSMISNCEYLFNEAWIIISTQKDIEKIPQYFYDRDMEVNDQEKAIRRLLLEHLTINPHHDLSGSLALMSLVKDAERIGDYSKNILEAGILFKGSIQDIKFFNRLTITQKNLSNNFIMLQEAYRESNEKAAKEILIKYQSVKKECDHLLSDIFEESLSTNEAIITGLISRYFKRINSHQSNIASGILYPLDQIDFVRGDLID